jgi:hypothetical protein
MSSRFALLAWLTTTSILTGCGASRPLEQPAQGAADCEDQSSGFTPCVEEPAPGGGASQAAPTAGQSALSFGLGVTAQLPEPLGGEPFFLQPGDSLPTGAQVSFSVEVSEDAHLYAFQALPGGAVSVLHPSAAMSLDNPLRQGGAGRIPPGSAAFKLNDQDMGITEIYFVVSVEPMADLDGVFGDIAAGKVGKVADSPVLRKVAAVVPASEAADCQPLDLSAPVSEGCRRPLGEDIGSAAGMDDSPGGISSGSMLLRAPADRPVIVAVFAFDHVPVAQYQRSTAKAIRRGIIMED